MSKKYLVAIDMEGVACAIGVPYEGISRGEGKNYAFAARQASREGCAAVDALFESGADEVIVWDAHGDGLNLDYEMFDKRCRFIQGGDMRMTKLSVFDNLSGVVFIGYHASDNTPDSILCHTYSMMNYTWNKINGEYVGEFEIDAALLGKKGAKAIFLSDDQFVTAQAKTACPWIETVTVKESSGFNSCVSMHPAAACDAIYEGVKNAVANLDTMKCYKIAEPFELTVCYKRAETAQLCHFRNPDGSAFGVVDAYTRQGTLSKIEDYFLH